MLFRVYFQTIFYSQQQNTRIIQKIQRISKMYTAVFFPHALASGITEAEDARAPHCAPAISGFGSKITVNNPFMFGGPALTHFVHGQV